MKKSVLLLVSLFSLAAGLYAQRPLGTWETYYPFGAVDQVTQSPDRIYCATPYSLYYIEKSDGSIRTLDKSNGLSDVNVRHIAYNSAMNTLVITYANSDIDLLVNGTDIYNIPDIKNAVISGSKNIYDIAMIGSFAYLASDIGISVLDLSLQQIDATYIIGSTGLSVSVYSIASDGVNLFAATSEGVKSAPLSTPNLQDYSVWTQYSASLGLPDTAASLVGQIGGTFYAVVRDTLYSWSGASFSKLRYDSAWTYANFSNTGGYLYASQQAPGQFGRLLQIQANDSISVISLQSGNSILPTQITIDGTTCWVADQYKALLKFTDFNYTETIKPDGPADIGVFRMTASDGVMYMAAGGTDNEYIGYNYDPSGPLMYDKDHWIDYVAGSNTSFSALLNCLDLVDVAYDKARQKLYYASLWGGLVELDLSTGLISATVLSYNHSNENALSACNCDNTKTKISALCLDRSGNLWMSNTNSTSVQSLVLKTPDDNWYEYTVPNGMVTTRKMMADSNGYVWMGGRTSAADNVVVYAPADSPGTTGQFISLTAGAGSGNLPNSDVWSMACDKEGNVWLGTDVGIATFYCTGSLFANYPQPGCDATWIKVDQGGYIGYLFSTQTVLALAVDGADRKWVGTASGVWLISADGTTQLLNFNTDNSPLPSNNITDIAVDQQTGLVWIGTDDGLVSYQGDAILGNPTKGTALVYPNPVKSGYNGPIAIKGLVDGAYVKITDASGTLVYQGQANGSEMIWNGTGYSGNKVSSGIYTVYADASDGSQHNVAKIIFIK